MASAQSDTMQRYSRRKDRPLEQSCPVFPSVGSILTEQCPPHSCQAPSHLLGYDPPSTFERRYPLNVEDGSEPAAFHPQTSICQPWKSSCPARQGPVWYQPLITSTSEFFSNLVSQNNKQRPSGLTGHVGWYSSLFSMSGRQNHLGA